MKEKLNNALNELDERVRVHGHKIAAIEECHNHLNPDAKLIQRKRNNDDETEDF